MGKLNLCHVLLLYDVIVNERLFFFVLFFLTGLFLNNKCLYNDNDLETWRSCLLFIWNLHLN